MIASRIIRESAHPDTERYSPGLPHGLPILPDK